MIYIILAGFASTDEPVSDCERSRLKGDVKSILETRLNGVDIGDTLARGEITFKKLTKYNNKGFTTEAVIYNNNGKSSILSYKFDTAGYQTGLDEYTEDQTHWLSVEYKLDPSGNKLEAIFDWLGKGGYDEIREKTEQLYEVIDRNPWDRVIYKNDYRGFHLEEVYMKNSGKKLFKFRHRYDILGNRIEMIYYNSKGRTSWETKYKYDRNNHLVESILFKSNRVAAISKFTYEYDPEGNWIRRVEERKVHYNILTAHLVEGTFVTEREIEYYPSP